MDQSFDLTRLPTELRVVMYKEMKEPRAIVLGNFEPYSDRDRHHADLDHRAPMPSLMKLSTEARIEAFRSYRCMFARILPGCHSIFYNNGVPKPFWEFLWEHKPEDLSDEAWYGHFKEYTLALGTRMYLDGLDMPLGDIRSVDFPGLRYASAVCQVLELAKEPLTPEEIMDSAVLRDYSHGSLSRFYSDYLGRGSPAPPARNRCDRNEPWRKEWEVTVLVSLARCPQHPPAISSVLMPSPFDQWLQSETGVHPQRPSKPLLPEAQLWKRMPRKKGKKKDRNLLNTLAHQASEYDTQRKVDAENREMEMLLTAKEEALEALQGGIREETALRAEEAKLGRNLALFPEVQDTREEASDEDLEGRDIPRARTMPGLAGYWPHPYLAYNDYQYVDPNIDVVVVEPCHVQYRCWSGFVNQFLKQDREAVRRLAIVVPVHGFKKLNIWDTIAFAFPNVEELIYLFNGPGIFGYRKGDRAWGYNSTHRVDTEELAHRVVPIDTINLFYLARLPFWMGLASQEHVNTPRDDDVDVGSLMMADAKDLPHAVTHVSRTINYDQVISHDWVIAKMDRYCTTTVPGSSYPRLPRHRLDTNLNNLAFRQWKARPTAPPEGDGQDWRRRIGYQGPLIDGHGPLIGGQGRKLSKITYAGIWPKPPKRSNLPAHEHYNASLFQKRKVLQTGDIIVG